VSQASFAGSARSEGEDLRRSSRVERQIPLLIAGHDGVGQEFLEQTAAVSLNLHGCRYASRHECQVGSWITLQLIEAVLGAKPSTMVRAQVKSVHPPLNPRDLFHVGVELETPGNIWGISPTPLDWRPLLGTMPFGTHTAAVAGPGRSSVMEMPVASRPTVVPSPEANPAPALQAVPPAAPHGTSLGTSHSGSHAAGTPQVVPLRSEGEPAKPNRVVVSSEQLLGALQTKLQAAAENAVQAAIAKHLEPAISKALASIEEKHAASVRSLFETITHQRSTLVHTSREEMTARIEDRLVEARGRWDAQMEGYRIRAEEIVQRLDRQAAAAHHDLAAAKETAERALRELEPKLSAQMGQALEHATRDFDLSAAQTAERHLARLSEQAQSLSSEAAAQLSADSATVKMEMYTAARSALEEFRRQSDVHAGLTLSETTQRITSTLAALDAENRVACETRRKSLESEVSRTGEQITQQFQQSLRAFFYSCLVAAVGAVEQHSKITLDGITPEGIKPPLREP
jgi:hypothetical protein